MIKVNKKKITLIVALIIILLAAAVAIISAKSDMENMSPEIYTGTYLLLKQRNGDKVKTYLCIGEKNTENNEENNNEENNIDKKEEAVDKMIFWGELYDSTGKSKCKYNGRLSNDRKIVFLNKKGNSVSILSLRGKAYYYTNENGKTIAVEKVSDVPVKAVAD